MNLYIITYRVNDKRWSSERCSETAREALQSFRKAVEHAQKRHGFAFELLGIYQEGAQLDLRVI